MSLIAATRLSFWRPGWPLPSLADLVFLVVLFGALRAGGLMLSADGDPGRHLTVGEHILATGQIPRVDVFSHTMGGQPFVPYEWLAEVLSALSYRWAGAAGPVLLHGGVIGLTFALVYWHLRIRGHAPLLAVGVALAAMSVSTIHWLARPHVFTFLGVAVFALVLDSWSRGRIGNRWLWVLPVSMAVWANLHGGFLVGLVLVAIYLGSDGLRWLGGSGQQREGARRRLWALGPVAAVTLAATLATPAGVGLLGHVTSYFGNRLLVDRTHEYKSPDFHGYGLLPFMAMLLASLAAMAWSRRRPTLHEGVLFGVFAAFSLFAARNIPLFAIVAAPVLAAELQELPPVAGWPGRVAERLGRWFAQANDSVRQSEARLGWHWWPVVAMVALVGLASAQWRNDIVPLGIDFDGSRQPVAAASYLRAHPPEGNGFNNFGWGGYLLHRLWPTQRVFIDGQTDFYGEPLAREYLRVVDLLPGWEDVLERYQVKWLIYDWDSPLVRVLAERPGWRVVYEDPLASVLVRGEARAESGSP